MENILQYLPHIQSSNLELEVRAHHAIILAYKGRFDEAEQIFDSLEPYVNSLSEVEKNGFENQKKLLNELRSNVRSK